MPIYRFRILDIGNRVTAGQYSHCKDDDAAREHADILAAQVKGLSVEIWSDQYGEVPRKRPDAMTPAARRDVTQRIQPNAAGRRLPQWVRQRTSLA